MDSNEISHDENRSDYHNEGIVLHKICLHEPGDPTDTPYEHGAYVDQAVDNTHINEIPGNPGCRLNRTDSSLS